MEKISVKKNKVQSSILSCNLKLHKFIGVSPKLVVTIFVLLMFKVKMICVFVIFFLSSVFSVVIALLASYFRKTNNQRTAFTFEMQFSHWTVMLILFFFKTKSRSYFEKKWKEINAGRKKNCEHKTEPLIKMYLI